MIKISDNTINIQHSTNIFFGPSMEYVPIKEIKDIKITNIGKVKPEDQYIGTQAKVTEGFWLYLYIDKN